MDARERAASAVSPRSRLRVGPLVGCRRLHRELDRRALAPRGALEIPAPPARRSEPPQRRPRLVDRLRRDPALAASKRRARPAVPRHQAKQRPTLGGDRVGRRRALRRCARPRARPSRGPPVLDDPRSVAGSRRRAPGPGRGGSAHRVRRRRRLDRGRPRDGRLLRRPSSRAGARRRRRRGRPRSALARARLRGRRARRQRLRLLAEPAPAPPVPRRDRRPVDGERARGLAAPLGLGPPGAHAGRGLRGRRLPRLRHPAPGRAGLRRRLPARDVHGARPVFSGE